MKFVLHLIRYNHIILHRIIRLIRAIRGRKNSPWSFIRIIRVIRVRKISPWLFPFMRKLYWIIFSR